MLPTQLSRKGNNPGKIFRKKVQLSLTTYPCESVRGEITWFSTDCFSDYFNEQAKKTETGINDYPEYAGEKASVEELKAQNSYFISSLYKDEE